MESTYNVVHPDTDGDPGDFYEYCSERCASVDPFFGAIPEWSGPTQNQWSSVCETCGEFTEGFGPEDDMAVASTYNGVARV